MAGMGAVQQKLRGSDSVVEDFGMVSSFVRYFFTKWWHVVAKAPSIERPFRSITVRACT